MKKIFTFILFLFYIGINKVDACTVSLSYVHYPAWSQFNIEASVDSTSPGPYTYSWHYAGAVLPFTGNMAEISDAFTTSQTICVVVTAADGTVCDACVVIAPVTSCVTTYDWFLATSGSLIAEAPSGAVHYSWTIDSTTVIGNDTHLLDTLLASGTYYICVSATYADGCVADYCEVVTIGTPVCSTHFGWNITALGTFVAEAPNGAVNYAWSIDGNPVLGNDTHLLDTLLANGTYNLCVIATFADGCMADYCEVVNIGIPACTVDFTWTVDSLGHVIAEAPSGALSYHWWLNGAMTSETTHVYDPVLAPGTYSICLGVLNSDSCYADVCNIITVASSIPDSCTTSFTSSIDTMGNFEATASGAAMTYTWSVDGVNVMSSSSPHFASALSPGMHVVCLHALYADSCVAEYCQNVVSSVPGATSCDISLSYMHHPTWHQYNVIPSMSPSGGTLSWTVNGTPTSAGGAAWLEVSDTLTTLTEVCATYTTTLADGSVCTASDCIVLVPLDSTSYPCMCSNVWEPVCYAGITYINVCYAECAGIAGSLVTAGTCDSSVVMWVDSTMGIIPRLMGPNVTSETTMSLEVCSDMAYPIEYTSNLAMSDLTLAIIDSPTIGTLAINPDNTLTYSGGSTATQASFIVYSHTGASTIYLLDIVQCADVAESILQDIYLQPTISKHQIYIMGFENGMHTEVYDIQGKIIETGTQNEIHITNYEAGMYFVKITADKESKVFKFIKQ